MTPVFPFLRNIVFGDCFFVGCYALLVHTRLTSHVFIRHCAVVWNCNADKVVEFPLDICGILFVFSRHLYTAYTAIHTGIHLLETVIWGQSNSLRSHGVTFDLECAQYFLLAHVEYLCIHNIVVVDHAILLNNTVDKIRD